VSSISQADTPHLTLVSSSETVTQPEPKSVDPVAFLQAITASLDLDRVLTILNRFLFDLVCHSGWEYLNAAEGLAFEGGQPDRHRLEYDLSLGGGEMGRLVLMRGRRFSELEQERIEALLGLAAPALKNALAYQTVLTQLESDPLTGLGNRIALFREGAHWLADAVRQSRPLSMLVLDLDGFKRINDQFGHPEGDRLLQAVAKGLRSATRASDLCVRMGGDEFVILLPGTDLTHAMECAERVRLAIEHCSSETAEGVRVGVCASIGVATHRPGMDLDQLYTQADEALYAAKRAGRNRTLAGAGCGCAMVRETTQQQLPLC